MTDSGCSEYDLSTVATTSGNGLATGRLTLCRSVGSSVKTSLALSSFN